MYGIPMHYAIYTQYFYRILEAYHSTLHVTSLQIRAVTIHDSMNQESIQNPNFQVNQESRIRINEQILLL